MAAKLYNYSCKSFHFKFAYIHFKFAYKYLSIPYTKNEQVNGFIAIYKKELN